MAINLTLVLDFEEDTLPSRLRGHKATKTSLKHDAFVLALSKALKRLKAKKKNACTRQEG
jgi:hypothetical protein